MQSTEAIIILVHVFNFCCWGQLCNVSRDVSGVVFSPMDPYRANLFNSGCRATSDFIAIQCDGKSLLLFDNDYGPENITVSEVIAGSRTIVWIEESYIVFEMGSMTTISAIDLYVINIPRLRTSLPNIQVYLPASLSQTEATSHTPQVSYDFLHNEHLSESDSTIRLITLHFRDIIYTKFVLLRWTFANLPYLLFGLSELRFCGDKQPSIMPQPIQFETPTQETTILLPRSGPLSFNSNCTVSNSGSFTWKWTRDDKTITATSPETRLLYYDGTRSTSLTIHNLDSNENSMVYSCYVVSDRYRNVTAVRHFFLATLLTLENYGIVKGTTTSITCEAYGFIENIHSSITWHFNGSPIRSESFVNVTEGSRYLVSFNEIRPSIISTLAVLELYGTYTCMIGNESASSLVPLPTTASIMPKPSTIASTPPPSAPSTLPTTTYTLFTEPPTTPTTVSTSPPTTPKTLPTAPSTLPPTTLPTAPTTPSTLPPTTSITPPKPPTTSPSASLTTPTTASVSSLAMSTSTPISPAAPPTTPPLAGTLDIKNVFVSIENLNITINTVYFEDSRASGAFFVFVSLNFFGVAEFENTNYLALDKKTSLNFTLPFSIKAGRTFIHVYDIEEDGSLTIGEVYPAVSKEIIVKTKTVSGPSLHASQYHLKNCLATPVLSSIEVACNYRDGPTVTGFQVIAHQRDENDKLFVVQAQNQSKARVPIRNNVQYQVVVFSIKDGSGIVGSNVEYLEQLIAKVKSTASTHFYANTADERLNTGNVVVGTLGGVLGLVVLISIVYCILRKYLKSKVKICRSQRFATSHSNIGGSEVSSSSLYTIPYENSLASL